MLIYEYNVCMHVYNVNVHTYINTLITERRQAVGTQGIAAQGDVTDTGQSTRPNTNQQTNTYVPTPSTTSRLMLSSEIYKYTSAALHNKCKVK